LKKSDKSFLQRLKPDRERATYAGAEAPAS
jgi:hypothetical protein